MKKYLLTTVMIFGAMTISTQAGCAGKGCTNINITTLYVNKTGTYVGTSGREGDVGDYIHCKPLNGKYFLLKKNHPNYEIMHSTLLATQISGKKATVKVELDKNSSLCQVAYITINN